MKKAVELLRLSAAAGLRSWLDETEYATSRLL